MRSEANTSLRGLAGAVAFFPFGISVVWNLHREWARVFAGCVWGTERLFSSLEAAQAPNFMVLKFYWAQNKLKPGVTA